MALNLTSRQARRAILLGAAGITLALAGCQTGPRGPVEPGPVEPPPTGLPQNGVAVIVPLTGTDGPVGTSIANAANLALADTGEKSLKITLALRDDPLMQPDEIRLIATNTQQDLSQKYNLG